ncbi:hypothetical protein ColTof4_09632 [Colletotrichum tofieldiae]|nr:hypothetical protein ColTof4_09632 [Colletotrichum tofieldiae]
MDEGELEDEDEDEVVVVMSWPAWSCTAAGGPCRTGHADWRTGPVPKALLLSLLTLSLPPSVLLSQLILRFFHSSSAPGLLFCPAGKVR